MKETRQQVTGDERPGSIRVDLHCHSKASDAAVSPEALADRLALAGVSVAALTDHDTVDGLEAFRRRLARHGIGFISGLELTAAYRGREVHLLAYGFDPARRDLRDALKAIRRGQAGGATSLAEAGPDTVPRGRMELADAIALVHRSGGKAFLAHPLALGSGESLREWLLEMKSIGLDGVEALYGPYGQDERAALLALAREQGLLVSAGGDWHGDDARGGLGVDMPLTLWQAFRSAVCFDEKAGALPAVPHARAPRGGVGVGVRIVLPVVLATVLFVTTLFAILLPAVERALVDRKREMIRELTRSVCSLLADYERQERAGAMDRAEAQRRAREGVRALRYGQDGKDYFWIQDLAPRMIMHPYRPDLEGTDLSGTRDARGHAIFNEFADQVRRGLQGYVSYVWQWQDDTTRQAAKESYVMGFPPWGWVVGTGMYVDDVHAQLGAIRRHLTLLSLGIVGIVGLVLIYMMVQSLRAERRRADAEDALHESHARYRAVVEAATEGALLVLNGRCRYANPTLRRVLGYEETQVELLGLEDVLPREREENRAAYAAIGSLMRGGEPEAGFSGILKHRNGMDVECALSLSRLPGVGGGFILMAREIAPPGRALRATPGADAAADWRVWLGGGALRPDGPAADPVAALAAAGSPDAVRRSGRTVPAVAAAMLRAGARSGQVTAFLSAAHDAAVARLARLAEAELGPPPRPYAFLALGSFGRQEPTLAADQDNALVYEGEPGDPAVADYFVALGARLCNGLEAAGYPFCRGQTLAGNPRWCQPASVWQRTFAAWIRSAEPKELMESSIFFDLRHVTGDPALALGLWRQIHGELDACPAFLPRFAGHTLQFKPPLRLFGRTLGGGGDSPGTLNLKDALAPIVGFARVYALRERLGLAGTRERLDGLAARGVIEPLVREDVGIAWEFLMRHRLAHQVDRLAQGEAPDNSIPDRELPPIEQAVLDQVFHRLVALQKMIRHDFLADG